MLALDTVAELELCSGCSDSVIFDGLPPGSLVRFVLRGDNVDVYLFARPGDPSASQGQARLRVFDDTPPGELPPDIPQSA